MKGYKGYKGQWWALPQTPTDMQIAEVWLKEILRYYEERWYKKYGGKPCEK